MNSGRPAVLLVAAKWWPLSARMAAALVRLDCIVSVLCPPHHPLTCVEGIRQVYPLKGIFSMASMQRALHESRPDFAIPCDDGVVAQLHAVHDADPSLRPLIERSLGPAEGFAVAESRFELLAKAVEWGIRVPMTRRVTSAQDLERWHDEVAPTAVLKVDGESGGHGVKISRSLNDSIAAWRAFRRPRGPFAAWKHLIIDRDPLALWSRRQKVVRDVTVQQFIQGRPANAMLACWQGKLLAAVCVTVVATEGPTGASTIVRLIQNTEMRTAAEKVAAGLKLTGFYGLDFILETMSGGGAGARDCPAYLIEMNPRCTQLGHIELPDQGSLAANFNAAMRGQDRPVITSPISKQTIALFPQALMAGEACRPYIDASYHDVPSNDTKLLNELMLKSWPQRQWLARLYHSLQPLDRSDPVVYEAAETLNTDRAQANEPRRQRAMQGVGNALERPV